LYSRVPLLLQEEYGYESSSHKPVVTAAYTENLLAVNMKQVRWHTQWIQRALQQEVEVKHI